MSPPPIESILAADVGSTFTKAVLIDTVEGEYRIIAGAEFPTTLEPPWSDVSLAVQQCFARIEQIAQRTLLDERGTLVVPEREDGSGVDAFVAIMAALAMLLLTPRFEPMGIGSRSCQRRRFAHIGQ